MDVDNHQNAHTRVIVIVPSGRRRHQPVVVGAVCAEGATKLSGSLDLVTLWHITHHEREVDRRYENMKKIAPHRNGSSIQQYMMNALIACNGTEQKETLPFLSSRTTESRKETSRQAANNAMWLSTSEGQETQ